MTKDEMKTLIRSLSDDELRTLRSLVTCGVDEWDGKTTINGKPFICPNCGGTGLAEIAEDLDEVRTAEELTLRGNCDYTVAKSRERMCNLRGDLYFECIKCRTRFDIDALEEMFDVTYDEEEGNEDH